MESGTLVRRTVTTLTSGAAAPGGGGDPLHAATTAANTRAAARPATSNAFMATSLLSMEAKLGSARCATVARRTTLLSVAIELIANGADDRAAPFRAMIMAIPMGRGASATGARLRL
jgi:hypothetical protein